MNDRPHHGQPPHRPVVFDPESGRWEVSPALRSNPSIPPPRRSEPDERAAREPLDAAALHIARQRRSTHPTGTGSSASAGSDPRRTGRRVGIAAALAGTFLLGYLLGDGVATSSATPHDQHAGESAPSYVGGAPTPGPPSRTES